MVHTAVEKVACRLQKEIYKYKYKKQKQIQKTKCITMVYSAVEEVACRLQEEKVGCALLRRAPQDFSDCWFSSQLKKRPFWEWNHLLCESFWWKPLQGIYRCSKIKPDKNSSYQQKFIFISTKNICTEQPAECDLVYFSKSHLTTIARQDDARHRWPDHYQHLIALLPHPCPLRVRTPPTK